MPHQITVSEVPTFEGLGAQKSSFWHKIGTYTAFSVSELDPELGDRHVGWALTMLPPVLGTMRVGRSHDSRPRT